MLRLNLTKSFLEKEYITKKRSSLRIAKETKHQKKTILKYLKEYNISRRNVADLNKKRGIYTRGKNSPCYVEKIKTNCAYCDKDLLIYPYRFKKYENNFCNRRCNAKFRTKEKAANWQGGLSFEEYPAEFNDQLKQEIRERDEYTCQLCECTEEEHILIYGTILDVHHIDYDKENCKKNNLTTLCRQCNCRVNYNREYWKDYFISKL